MRVRIARSMYNNPGLDSPRKEKAEVSGASLESDEDDIFNAPQVRNGGKGEGGAGGVSEQEQKVLDRVGEDLARLGRVKRVGLGVPDKVEFVRVWTKRRR